MHKVLISIILYLGIVCSTHVYALEDQKSASATISFQVDILRKQCNVSVNPLVGDSVSVGKLLRKAGTMSQRIPLKFKFTECKGAIAVENIAFIRDIYGEGHVGQEKYVSTQMNGQVSPVRIYLYSDATSTNPFNSINFGSAGRPITENWIDVCYIQAKIPLDQSLPEKGDFSGTAEFLVSYL